MGQGLISVFAVYVGVIVSRLCVFFMSRNLRKTNAFIVLEQSAPIPACDDPGWPACAAVNSEWLKEF